MNIYPLLINLWMIIIPTAGQTHAKQELNTRDIQVGETLSYKATWGFLTIGSGTTKIDTKLYRIGSAVCYKIEINGQTYGVGNLFYVRDKWESYIDTATITTHRSFRSIREGRHELDEIIHFDQQNNKAAVKVYDKKMKSYVLKKIYDTPESVRDVVAGFMYFRLFDLSKYSKGDVFTVNGFYEDEGYQIDVVFMGKEYVQIKKNKMLCYWLKPVLPKNKIFNGRDAVDVWLSADSSKTLMRIHAKMFIGNIVITLDN